MARQPGPSELGLEVGAITSAHGIGGAVRARLWNLSADDLPPGTVVTLCRDDERTAFEVVRADPVPGKPMIRLHLAGVSTRNQAEALRGSTVEIARSVLGALDADELFLADVIGHRVEGTVGDGPSRDLGRVEGLGSNGAQELLEVRGQVGGRRTTWYIPVLPQFIRGVADGVVRVVLPEGMGPEDAR